MAAPQYPIALNSLQKEFKECYEKSRKSIKLPQYILKDLEQYTLFLADLELNDEDCPILSQFLTSKLAASKIDKLMVGPKTFSIIPHARRGDSKNEASHSALNLDKSKLWKAVIKFIEKSENLKFVVVDSVFMSLELIHMLGLALSVTKSKIKWFGLKNVPLEDRGLRLLSPHLAKSSIQLLALEKCGLTDQSTSYLASIIKAQEARMDSLYWNLTLRQASSAADNAELMSSGLLALSISGNKLNGESHMALAKVIKRNDWLLALNMGRNELSKEAIVSFMDAIKSNEKCHVIVFNGNPGLDIQLNEEIVKKFQKVSKASSKFSVLSSNVASVVKKWIAESENFQVETPVTSSSSSLNLNNNVSNINNNKLSASFVDVEGSIEFENDYLNTKMNLPSSHSSSSGRVDESSSNNFLLSSIQDSKLDALEHGIPSSPQLNSFDILESALSDNNSANDKRPPSRSGVRQRHVKNFDNYDLNTSNSNFNLALASFNSVLPAQEVKSSSNFDSSANNISTSKRPQSAPPASLLTLVANGGLAGGKGGRRGVSNTSINVKSSLEGALSKRLSTASSAASNSNSNINSSTRMKSRMTSSAITSSDTSILKKQPSSTLGGKSSSASRVSPTRRGSASVSANNSYYNNNAGGSSSSSSNSNNNKSNNNKNISSSYDKLSSKATIVKAVNTKTSTPKKTGGGGKTKADQLTQVMEKMMEKMIETSQNLSNAAEKLNESLSSHSSMMANSRQDLSFLQESKLNSSNVFEDLDTSAHNSQNQNPFLLHGSGEKKQQLRAGSNNSNQQVENQHMFSPNNRGGGGVSNNNNNNNNLAPRSPTRPQSASPYNSRDTSDILAAKFASASLEGNDGKEILQLIRDRLREKLKVHLSS